MLENMARMLFIKFIDCAMWSLMALTSLLGSIGEGWGSSALLTREGKAL